MAPLAAHSIRRDRPRVHACLIYHGVIAPGDPAPLDSGVHMPVETLGEHLDILLGLGAMPTTIDDIAERIASDEPLPPFSASITFDDAYANIVTNALPLLTEKCFSATVFAPASLIDTEQLQWNDQVHALVGDGVELARRASREAGLDPVTSAHELVYALKGVPDEVRQETIRKLEEWCGLSDYPHPGSSRICTEGELRTLQSHGWRIGAHTLTHPILTTLSDEESVAEIVGSRERLGQILGDAPRGFAYPDGAFAERHMRMVEDAGYGFAVTTEGALTVGSQNAMALSRIYPQPHPARFTCLVTGFEQRARRMLRL